MATTNQITINGAFSTQSANSVAFDKGATGNIISTTATQLVVQMTKLPSSTGTLRANVTNGGGSSGLVAVANVTSLIHSKVWTGLSPGDVAAIYGGGTTAWTQSALESTNALNGTSHWLSIQNFDPGDSSNLIPTDATIVGVKIRMPAYAVSGTVTETYAAFGSVTFSGFALGSNLTSGNQWTSGPNAFRSYGGAAELWGLSLTPSYFNDGSVTFVIAVSGASGAVAKVPMDTTNHKCDMTIYYTVPA